MRPRTFGNETRPRTLDRKNAKKHSLSLVSLSLLRAIQYLLLYRCPNQQFNNVEAFLCLLIYDTSIHNFIYLYT